VRACLSVRFSHCFADQQPRHTTTRLQVRIEDHPFDFYDFDNNNFLPLLLFYFLFFFLFLLLLLLFFFFFFIIIIIIINIVFFFKESDPSTFTR
jgi:hypothetical protein